MVHENNVKITVSVCGCRNKLAYGIEQLGCILYINVLLTFYVVKKQKIISSKQQTFSK